MQTQATDSYPFEIDEQARDRAEGAYDHYSMQRDYYRRMRAENTGVVPVTQQCALAPAKQAALDAALAQIDRAFGPFDRATGRRLPKLETVAMFSRVA